MLIPTLLASIAAVATPQDAGPAPAGVVQQLVRVELPARGLEALTALDLDILYVDRAGGVADVAVGPEGLRTLEAAGLTHRVVTADLADWYARRLAAGASVDGGPYGTWLSPPFGQGGMGGYYTLAQIGSVLDQLRAAYPGAISAKQSIGLSLEGRELWMVRVSDNPDVDEGEPEVRVDSLHHAREPQGMQSSLWFMLYLLEEYGTDPLATYLVDERELYFILCVNPDGYEYNRQTDPGGGGLWRKNRRNNGGGSFGVDLNRNYPFQWGFDNSGSSADPNSQTYRGTAPASEPEVAAMVAFMAAHQFQTALSVHTYSNLWLSPWGYDTPLPPGWPELDEVGTLATEVNGYEHGPASTVLYLANGVTIDHDHGVHGTLSWTPEIGSPSDGFWPPQSRIVPLAEENLLAFQRTALAGGPWVRIEQLGIVDAGNGNGSYEPGERVEFNTTLRNSGTLSSGVVDLALSSSSPFASIVVGQAGAGPIPSFSSGQGGLALALEIVAGTPAGTLVPFTVTLTYDGYSQDVSGELFIGTEVTLASFDFESGTAEGWAVGPPNDATSGEWVRDDPRGTAAQPEDDHTPAPGTRCWFTGQGSPGGSVGENDVDDGSTTLVSPVFDLANRAQPRIEYWRWYSNNQGAAPSSDVFQVDLSNDGGASWVSAETVGPAGPGTSGGWQKAVIEVASILAPTSQVRIRFIASDLGAGSIVEAALDDVEVLYFEGPSCPAPTGYCVTSPNSVGPGALIGWSGSTDVGDDDFTLTASGAIPNQFGLFFYAPGQGQFPIGNGFVCLGGGFFRLPVGPIDAGGNASHTVDFASPPSGGAIQNGATWNFQFWYRDPSIGSGFDFSDAVEVEFCAD